MHGTIFKRNNKYYAVYYTGEVVDGKYKQKWSKGFKYKKDCKKFLDEQIRFITGKTAFTSSVALGDYLLRWLEQHAVQQNLAKNTYNGYKVNICKHIIPVLGEIPLNALTADDIDRLLSVLSDNGLSGTSRRYVFATLRRALNTAVKRRIIDLNVCELVEAPAKSRFKSDFLTVNQLLTFKSVLDNHDLQYSMPFYFAVFLGLRRGEILGLKWSDFNFSEKLVSINRTATPAKGGYSFSPCKTENSQRVLMLPEELILKICDWEKIQRSFLPEAEYVLQQQNGKILTANTLNSHFKKLLAEGGLPAIRFHDLRHSWASFLALSDVPIKITSQMLGHSDISTTLKIYTHTNSQMQKQAIDVIDKLL
ncbi:MAG: site-specific integrase [Clostridiales bacterium]|nr:site-specific integrase [Clostridiales bacterium]